MLTKTGMLELTAEELQEVEAGRVPGRIKSGWGYDSSELTELVKSGEFVKLDPKKDQDPLKP